MFRKVILIIVFYALFLAIIPRVIAKAYPCLSENFSTQMFDYSQCQIRDIERTLVAVLLFGFVLTLFLFYTIVKKIMYLLFIGFMFVAISVFVYYRYSSQFISAVERSNVYLDTVE